MRAFTAVATLMAVPSLGVTQGAPGTNVSVTVGVSALSMRGDTADVTYVLKNAPSSGESLAQFIVDAPAPVFRIFAPVPQASWFTSTLFGERSVALWAALDAQVPPGQDSPPLRFEAFGLPTIVACWSEGYYPPPTDIPSDTAPLPDILASNSVPDTTVGLEPFPIDRSAGNLLVRLRGLLDQTCGTALAWITSSTVCTSLGAKLDMASQKLSQADTAGARAQIESFLSELEAQHGSGLPVNDSAYWLLKVNAEYILTRL